MVPEFVLQNFADPLGLTALLSIIPLIIFYLVKPKPERKIMPSMTFFAERKDEGKIRTALRKLKANRILFLHLLLVVGAAFAIANPLLPGFSQQDNTVLILDTSASMIDDEKEVKRFASSNLARENTVITAGSDVEILGTNLSKPQAKNALINYDASMTGSNLVKGLRTALDFEGKILVASDMDNIEVETIKEFKTRVKSNNRKIKTINVSHQNSHGFTNLEKSDGKIKAEISNFKGYNKSLTVRKPGENIEVNIKPYSRKNVVLNFSEGTYKAVLPSDEFAPDNKLYISVPENKEIEVKQIGKQNKFFEKAVELIDKTENVEGDSLSGADLFYINNNYEITDERLDQLSKLNNEGKSLIFEDRTDLPSFVPVDNRSVSREVVVRLDQQPVTSFQSNVTGYDVKGESLATPQEALVISSDENVLLNNVNSSKFGEEITYPIFWKQTILKMAEIQTFQDLNFQTGEKTGENNEVFKNQYVNEAGFHEGGETYASNLLDFKESKPSIKTVKIQENSINKLEKGSVQKHLLTLLTFISILELFYLSKRGALQ